MIDLTKKKQDDFRRERILETFWTKDDLENYKFLEVTKFSTWDVKLTKEEREIIGYSEVLDSSMNIEQERKYYFFEDFYLSCITTNEITIYIIGKDPDKNEYFNTKQE